MTDVSRDLVDAVGDAFNNNDIDTVMQYFADNATFDHAAGPDVHGKRFEGKDACLLYTSPSPRDQRGSRMPSSA